MERDNTAGDRHRQNGWFCGEVREDGFRFWWRGVHEDASRGVYVSKIVIFFFTSRVLQGQRVLCCGECFRDWKHVWFVLVCEVWLSQGQSSHEGHDEGCDTLAFLGCSRRGGKLDFQCFFIVGVWMWSGIGSDSSEVG